MSLLDVSPVIPVVVIENPDDAVPVARALLAGGVSIIELTLRTTAATECIRRIAEEVPEILVGAGTVLDPRQADRALSCGARFLVSPGITAALLSHFATVPVPVLPGVSTVAEAMEAYAHGFTELKFFPAEAAGGSAYLRAMAGPLPQLTFCPTGGVTAANMDSYLALDNVNCVGGSWLTPRDALRARRWDEVTRLAGAVAPRDQGAPLR